jgi:hypothetical protein
MIRRQPVIQIERVERNADQCAEHQPNQDAASQGRPTAALTVVANHGVSRTRRSLTQAFSSPIRNLDRREDTRFQSELGYAPSTSSRRTMKAPIFRAKEAFCDA